MSNFMYVIAFIFLITGNIGAAFVFAVFGYMAED